MAVNCFKLEPNFVISIASCKFATPICHLGAQFANCRLSQLEQSTCGTCTRKLGTFSEARPQRRLVNKQQSECATLFCHLFAIYLITSCFFAQVLHLANIWQASGQHLASLSQAFGHYLDRKWAPKWLGGGALSHSLLMLSFDALMTPFEARTIARKRSPRALAQRKLVCFHERESLQQTGSVTNADSQLGESWRSCFGQKGENRKKRKKEEREKRGRNYYFFSTCG